MDLLNNCGIHLMTMAQKGCKIGGSHRLNYSCSTPSLVLFENHTHMQKSLIGVPEIFGLSYSRSPVLLK